LATFAAIFCDKNALKSASVNAALDFSQGLNLLDKIQNIFLHFFPLFCQQKILIKILINLPL